MFVLDRDGGGPEREQLVVAGWFGRAGGVVTGSVATWDGDVWSASFPGLTGLVGNLVVDDADGTGPGAPALYACGFLTVAGGSGPVYGAARWADGAWTNLPGVFNGRPTAGIMFDADGEGPGPSQYYVVGGYAMISGQTFSSIARWDGALWRSLASGVQGGHVRALATFDFDGAGPQPARLVAGGDFVTASAVPARYAAVWDGSQWSSPWTSPPGAIHSLAVADLDGAGPGEQRLFAVSGQDVVYWDGAAWVSLNFHANDVVRYVAEVDIDGPGSALPGLLVGGEFSQAAGAAHRGVAWWDGSAWGPVPGGSELASPWDVFVGATAVFDVDGAGPLEPRLHIGGGFVTAGELSLRNVAVMGESGWEPLGPGFDRLVTALGSVDWPDGSRRLLVGTKAPSIHNVGIKHVVSWDGGRWVDIGQGLQPSMSTGEGSDIYSFSQFDPDSPGGPEPSRPVATGIFFLSEPASHRGVAMWHDGAWRALPTEGGYPPQSIECAIGFGDTGSGPDDPQFIAAGTFQRSVGHYDIYVARRLGTEWQLMGSRFQEGFLPYVNCLAVYDPDEDGPIGPSVFAGGSILPLRAIARWVGTSWVDVGSGLAPSSARVTAMKVFDVDGPGPRLRELVAGGTFTSAGGTMASNIASWDGSQWRPVGVGTNGSVKFFSEYDPDGAGSARPWLIAGGGFTWAGGVTTNQLAAWDGSSWRGFGGGPDGNIEAMTTFDADGAGPEPTDIVVAGNFQTVGGVLSPYFARWGPKRPLLVRQPGDVDGMPGGEAVFRTAAQASSEGAVQYQWRHRGAALSDGPTAGGAMITGSTGKVLWITDLSLEQAGEYDCVISDACGTVRTVAARLTMGCASDLTGDGVVDFGDYLEFLNLFEAQDPRVDLNGDGVIDFGDYLEFLNRFDAGC